MEFLDEDTRPRFLFQSRAPASSSADPLAGHEPRKPFLFFTITISSLLLALSILHLQSELFRSLLFWLSISLLLGPFAPISLTGGDIRVGCGPIVEFPDQEPETLEETTRQKKKPKSRRSEEQGFANPVPLADNLHALAKENSRKCESKSEEGIGFSLEQENKNWTEEDIEILRKQLLKHPVGKPRRWEVIAEAFKGRHNVESVIKKAKELGEKKIDDSDSYVQFLKKRKPVDKRVENGNEGVKRGEDGVGEGGGSGWNSGEDIALLNALKAFPKDASMRWEKIAAAVPGKSKAACTKRVAELKREFRTAKAAGDG